MTVSRSRIHACAHAHIWRHRYEYTWEHHSLLSKVILVANKIIVIINQYMWSWCFQGLTLVTLKQLFRCGIKRCQEKIARNNSAQISSSSSSSDGVVEWLRYWALDHFMHLDWKPERCSFMRNVSWEGKPDGAHLFIQVFQLEGPTSSWIHVRWFYWETFRPGPWHESIKFSVQRCRVISAVATYTAKKPSLPHSARWPLTPTRRFIHLSTGFILNPVGRLANLSTWKLAFVTDDLTIRYHKLKDNYQNKMQNTHKKQIKMNVTTTEYSEAAAKQVWIRAYLWNWK